MHRRDTEGLDPRQEYWVPVIVSPERDWTAAPGCHKGARYIVDRETMTASRDAFEPFDSRLSCLDWIMANRADLHRALPGATVRAVRLDRWLLGLE
jgi:hypothetical protein